MKIRNLLSKPLFWFLIIFLIGAFLRIYRLPEYVHFLGDEGRDALVVKRIIVDHQFTLLGPTASVGGFYIGPLYYYFIAPFLWLSGLNPVGPAYFDVLIGMGFLALIYWFCKNTIGSKGALIATALATISPQMINISRFSWNPNPMPFFALLSVSFLYLSQVKKQMKYVFLAGLCVGILQQLHYIDLVFIPILGVLLLLFYRGKNLFWAIIWAGLGFLLGYSLFLIFELRHGFPNLKSVWEFATRGGKTVSPRSWDFSWLFNDIFIRTFEIDLGLKRHAIDVYYFLSLLGFAYFSIKNWKTATGPLTTKLILVWMVIGVIGVGSYQGSLYDHYFGFLLPLPFILLGMLSEIMFSLKKWVMLIGIAGLLILSYFSVKSLYLWSKPNNQIEQSKAVAKLALSMTNGKSYNFALITPGNSDHAYRYFLEIWGHPPVVIENPQVDPDRKTLTSQLIVVCEQVACQPLGNPLWEVAGFGRAEIESMRTGPAGIIMYKLVHYTGN